MVFFFLLLLPPHPPHVILNVCKENSRQPENFITYSRLQMELVYVRVASPILHMLDILSAHG